MTEPDAREAFREKLERVVAEFETQETRWRWIVSAMAPAITAMITGAALSISTSQLFDGKSNAPPTPEPSSQESATRYSERRVDVGHATLAHRAALTFVPSYLTSVTLAR